MKRREEKKEEGERRRRRVSGCKSNGRKYRWKRKGSHLRGKGARVRALAVMKILRKWKDDGEGADPRGKLRSYKNAR